MYIGKLFNEYPVNVNIDNPINVIYGANGTGKTKTIELLKDYLISQDENVLYFPTERRFLLTEEEVESIMSLDVLSENSVFRNLNINLNKFDRIPKYGDFIHSGYLQLVNIFCQLYKLKEESIIIIDNPERNLHISIQRRILTLIKDFTNVKKLVVVTHSPEFLSWDGSETDIKDCVDIHSRIVKS